MSLATDTAARTDRGAAAVGADVIVDLKPMWIGLAVLSVFYLIVRVYEQIYGWRAGLDSFAPEFQTYWLSILWTEIPLELVSGIALAGYLWKTRIRDMSTVTPRQEMRAIVDNAKWLTAYAVAIYWGRQLLHGAGRHLAAVQVFFCKFREGDFSVVVITLSG
jgi:methane/ammonia monooxygenase subunit C